MVNSNAVKVAVLDVNLAVFMVLVGGLGRNMWTSNAMGIVVVAVFTHVTRWHWASGRVESSARTCT